MQNLHSSYIQCCVWSQSMVVIVSVCAYCVHALVCECTMVRKNQGGWQRLAESVDFTWTSVVELAVVYNCTCMHCWATCVHHAWVNFCPLLLHLLEHLTHSLHFNLQYMASRKCHNPTLPSGHTHFHTRHSTDCNKYHNTDTGYQF